MNQDTPPAHDELEISVIGPGRGETIILHLGHDEWVIVDSCIAKGTNEASALSYLRLLGPHVPQRIRLVAATHWHDDHIQGLASILAAAPDARFACSTALSSNEFATLVGIAADPVNPRGGLDELLAVLGELQKRPADRAHPQWTIEQRELLHLSEPSRAFPVSIRALSPSDAMMTAALHELSTLIPAAGQPRTRIRSQAPNGLSVVLWLDAGPRSVLLGADLEQKETADRGSLAVVGSHRAGKRAQVFKVPHHGSKNAECEDVWTQMLTPQPIAIVTPFNGGKGLPAGGDLRRIEDRTSNGYCTAGSRVAAPKRAPMVEKKFKQVVKRSRTVRRSARPCARSLACGR